MGFDDHDLAGKIDELRIWNGGLSFVSKIKHFAYGPDGSGFPWLLYNHLTELKKEKITFH